MKREWLKELGLEADVIDKIMDENGKDVNKVKGESEALKSQKTELETQLSTANTTISELKSSNTSNQELQTKVTEYETQIATLKADADKQLFEKDLDIILTNANVHSLKAAKALLDMEKVKRGEDGALSGVAEQVESWKKDSPWMIKTGGTKTDYNPAGGGNPGEVSVGASIAKERNTSYAPVVDPWATK